MSAELFVGRSGELEVAAKWLRRADAGQASVLWIEADAGSGKSAFVREFLRRCGPDVTTLRGEADELASDRTFDLVRQLGPVASEQPFAVGLELLDRFGAVRGDGTLVVVIEDFHWGDAGSREALLTTARRLRDDRVLTLITTRPSSEASEGFLRLLSDPDRGERLVLSSLTTTDVQSLATMGGRQLDAAAAERLRRHTGGHALYVRTLLSELSLAQLTGTDISLPAPRSLAATTVARLAELDPAARAIAQALAVLGERAALATVGQVGAVRDPLPAVEALLETNFVQWRPDGPRAEIAFTHPLYRAAVEDDLAPTLRRRLHLAAADVLGGDLALLHRHAAADGPDDGLAAALRSAAERDGRTAEEAARFLGRASDLYGEPEQCAHALLDALELLLASGDQRRAVEIAERLAAFAPTSRASLLLGRLAWRLGDATAAEEALRAVTDRAGDAAPRATRGAALAELALIYAATGRGVEAAAAGEEAIALLPADGALTRHAIGATAVGIGALRGGTAGIEWLAQHLPDGSDGVEHDVETVAVRGTLAYFAGRSAAAVRDMQAAIGARPGQSQLPRAHLHLSQALVALGRWDEALVQTHVALSLVADNDFPWLTSRIESAAATVCAYRGERDEAAAHLAVAHAAVTADNPESLFAAQIATATLARVEHRWDDVITDLAPFVAGGEAALPMLAPLRWWQWLLEALIDTGVADVVDQIDELERGARRRRVPLDSAVLALRGRLAFVTGGLDTALAPYERATATTAPDEPVLEVLLRRWSHGRVLAALGERRSAAQEWTAVREELVSLGAAPFIAHLDEDLRAIGSKTLAKVPRAPLELTGRESDVATLVVKGMTNREVASSLYVSEKAVEYHLSNIFGKLGIRSRRELPAALIA